jgi:hypothetical protein
MDLAIEDPSRPLNKSPPSFCEKHEDSAFAIGFLDYPTIKSFCWLTAHWRTGVWWTVEAARPIYFC